MPEDSVVISTYRILFRYKGLNDSMEKYYPNSESVLDSAIVTFTITPNYPKPEPFNYLPSLIAILCAILVVVVARRLR